MLNSITAIVYVSSGVLIGIVLGLQASLLSINHTAMVELKNITAQEIGKKGITVNAWRNEVDGLVTMIRNYRLPFEDTVIGAYIVNRIKKEVIIQSQKSLLRDDKISNIHTIDDIFDYLENISRSVIRGITFKILLIIVGVPIICTIGTSLVFLVQVVTGAEKTRLL